MPILASYAQDPSKTKGRIYAEKSTPYRNEFERDRDRIIHSNSFKRLQYKTQVFVNHAGDLYRNRLTHSIEVSSVARSVSKELLLCEDLAESVALAHDLGHTPFGHAGEEALNNCMRDHGGFSHNAHSLKLVTKLEQKYASYDGLNLSWEVLEGLVKHNGPLVSDIPSYILDYNEINDLELNNFSSAEAQTASLSDDIAYICHDIEDSVKAKIIDLDDLTEIDFIGQYVRSVKSEFKGVHYSRLVYEVVRKLMHHFIESLLEQTKFNFQKQSIESSDDIRNLGYQLVDFTDEVKAEIKQIKRFLLEKVYKHHHITSVTLRCKKIVKALFEIYMDDIHLLPISWRNLVNQDNCVSKASVVSDYIAGMTDRFAIAEYKSYNNLNFNNIDL